MSDYKRYFINDRIRAEKLRVIGSKGENFGEMTRAEALDKARTLGLDLVEIGPKSVPPVAKLLDFKKFMYDERKKTSASKAHSKQSGLKEFKMGPNIGENDFNVRISRAREFLKDKDRVKFHVVFSGRQMAHTEIGWDKIKKVVAVLDDVGKEEAPPRMVGKIISVMILPR